MEKEEMVAVVTPQPEFTLNSVTVIADSVDLDIEISEEV